MHMEYMKAIYLVAELFFHFFINPFITDVLLPSIYACLTWNCSNICKLSGLNIADSFKYSSDGFVPTPALPACPILVSLI